MAPGGQRGDVQRGRFDHQDPPPPIPQDPPLTGHAHLADEVHVFLLVLLRHQHVGSVGFEVPDLTHPKLLHLGEAGGGGGGGVKGQISGQKGHPRGRGDNPRHK